MTHWVVLLASAVILNMVEAVRADLASVGIVLLDLWYFDDMLRALNAHFAAVGATRGVGFGVKGVVRVLGTEIMESPQI